MNLLEQMAAGIDRIRTQKPLIHHITNYISMNDCANITLAIGASPIMANDPAEVEEVVSQSAALVLNIGTPNTRMLGSMLLAGKKANERGIPVVLDPVGVGLTAVRTRIVEQLLMDIRIDAIRGNLAEIKRLTGIFAAMRGIDALAVEENAAELVFTAAKKMDCIVAATGSVDFISDGRKICRVENGAAMMARVTGTGCMTTSLVAACCAGMASSLPAAAAGILYMGTAGEIAHAALNRGEGTASFRIRLLDAVSNLTSADILERGRCVLE